MADIKVGGEVDAFCTRCKMVLAHTTLAVWAGEIKRVRCNTCMGEHAYRSGKPSAVAAPKAARATTARAGKAVAEKVSASTTYDSLIAGKDRSSARRYGVKERFAIGELIEHPSFGLGVVAAVRGFDKIDVAFSDGVKTLLHAKGLAPAPIALPVKTKQRAIVDLPAEKSADEDEDEDEDEEDEDEPVEIADE